jgi:phage baseplate assembly protein W
MAISFNSVGKRKSERLVERDEGAVGVVTPLRNSARFGTIDMHTRLLDQINDNLKNLILTNNGERLVLFDFGANLKKLLFEQESDELEERIAVHINEAVSKYMPFVKLDELDVQFSNNDINEVSYAIVKITYNVPSINDKIFSLELGVAQ